jgi:hypothetical protein
VCYQIPNDPRLLAAAAGRITPMPKFCPKQLGVVEVAQIAGYERTLAHVTSTYVQA